MRTAIAEMLGIEHPLLAFSHSERVVVAVSRAGGLGVLGAAQLTADELEEPASGRCRSAGHRAGKYPRAPVTALGEAAGRA